MQATEGTYIAWRYTDAVLHQIQCTQSLIFCTHFQTIHYVSAAAPSSDLLLKFTVSFLMHKKRSPTLGWRPSLTISHASQQINELLKVNGDFFPYREIKDS